MRELQVLLNGKPVGLLQETRKGARFAYADDLVKSHQGDIVLSASLPVKQRPYAEGLTGSWFQGLLPEGDRLSRIAQDLGCAPSDYLGILAEIGWECAGAVSIVDPERTYPTATTSQSISFDQLAQEIKRLPAYEREQAGTMRVSLGGYQEKLCVVADDIVEENGVVTAAAIALPDAATMSTHILKPQPLHEYPGLIEAEAWAMAVARNAARGAKTALLKLDDAPPTLMAKRFDRQVIDGTVQRIHQEDCCQALGLSPAEKYASTSTPRGNDPTYKRIAALLMNYAEKPFDELSELYRQLIVNLALGNTDAHAKNYSLLYRVNGLPELSPLYDVVPVMDIEPKAGFLSMRIGGEIQAEKVSREHLLQEALSWGLTKAQAETLLDETLEALEEGAKQARELYPNASERHEANLKKRIRRLS